MAIPNIKDLVMYVNKALTGNDWNTNWQKIINWLTGGDTDINVKSITVSQSGGITNNGTLTQSGNLSVGGNISATGNLNIDGVISGNGSGLTGVVSAATIAYTPFCVNSGNIDSDGKGDLFDYDAGVSTSIEFKVDDSKPITFTNAKGKTTTLTAINSYDLSQTDNGTYIVFITENATAVTLTSNGSKVFRQPYAPTSPQPLDIWLDTSCEGLKSYIRQSGSWEENNLVILGEVTIANHTVSSATTYLYNWNGYNINTPEANLTKNEYPRIVVQSFIDTNSFYRIYSDGFVEQGKAEDSTGTKNLLIEMKDTKYVAYVSGFANVNTFYDEQMAIGNRTTTTITIRNGGGSMANCWYVCGFKA